MFKEIIPCDICDKKIYLSPKQKYDLKKDGWSVYCKNCADKLHLTNREARDKQIKIYKV